MGYSFIISTSIKQVKDLELILSVPFVFGSWCCETTLCGQRIVVKGPHCVVSIQVKQTIVRLQKQNKSIREIAGTLGVAKSTVWYILRKKNRMHWWAQQHKKAWTSTEDNSGGWLENPLHRKEKPFHNIQPSEEHSPGGRCVTVKVYNQEKISPEQIKRVHHKVQTRPDYRWISIN